MKQLLISATLLLSSTVFAQFQDRFLSGSTTSEGNFYEIKAQGEAYYSSVIDTNKGNGKKSFDRWEYFWSKRVDAPNSSDGSYRHALNALYSIMNNPVCPSSTYSNWSNISPGVIPFADQALGIITAVEFDPVNPTTTFYAGTPTSGLWKTTDGVPLGYALLNLSVYPDWAFRILQLTHQILT